MLRKISHSVEATDENKTENGRCSMRKRRVKMTDKMNRPRALMSQTEGCPRSEAKGSHSLVRLCLLYPRS